MQKDQLNLQSVDILSLRESLQVEQQRYRQLWDDREMVVTRLHNQIRQLQQGRDDYYTKNQELQVHTDTFILHSDTKMNNSGYICLQFQAVTTHLPSVATTIRYDVTNFNQSVFCVSRASYRSVRKGWMNWRQSFRGPTTKSATLVTSSTR